jgi:UDP-N-acetylglucosamine 2-epimerase (hydrolysing)
MRPKSLPNLFFVKNYYNIEFQKYSILMFHPVTTEYPKIKKHIKEVVDAVIKSNLNYIVIYPNNDLGSIEILQEYERLKDNPNFKIFPSIRFEYFLQLLRNAEFIIGNSSAGIMEAPFYDTPTIDIGSRQQNRAKMESIFHTDYDKDEILSTIKEVQKYKKDTTHTKYHFGDGRSDIKFLELLKSEEFWQISQQKQFQELEYA